MSTRPHRCQSRFAFTDTATAVLIIIFALAFIAAGRAGGLGLWGLNHLRYLPPAFEALAWLGLIFHLLCLHPRYAPVPALIAAWGHELFFGRLAWQWRLGLAALAGAAFWFFQAETHFLGDGLTWTANFSQAAGHVRKWAEFGSIPLVRTLQGLLGGYTRGTAEAAFRAISIAAGIAALLGLFPLVALLVKHPVHRVAALATLLFSGAGLLYFGYVEFYPLLWAAAVWFFRLALVWLQEHRAGALAGALLVYAAALCIHVQAVWLAGAAAALVPGVVAARTGELSRRRSRLLLATLGLGALAAYLWFLFGPTDRNWIVLPPWSGRIEAPEYAVFSLKHLGDLFNLALVLFPGAVVLAAARLRPAGLAAEPIAVFLAAASLGGLCFALCLNPVIGMGRDWDLLSLAGLPAVLWLFHRLERVGPPLTRRVGVELGVLAMMTGVTYWAANLRVEASEERFLSLLRWYGGKDYSGWKAFETYLVEAGRAEEAAQVGEEIRRVFPHQALLADGWRNLQSGQAAEARRIAEHLVSADPDRAEHIHLLGESLAADGNLAAAEQRFREAIRKRPDYAPALRSLAQSRMRSGSFGEACRLLRQARRLDPGAAAILEDLGAAYLRLNYLDSAAAVADTLLAMESRSPGGHLIRMLAAVRSGDEATARRHFLTYREHGRQRPEYAQIVSAYGGLAPDR
ncbi:MAG TPA: hypothetical protein PKW75_01090 [candidate division Zixibacteria bacterium]|nr:hypothetical protein [candidate division Zixibacteria bacterium]MDD4917444.1 hypothetical protein [candidate division Zixibacteria bacterium]MDM7973002.1 hypothetical protein [candidate division Zixibacteria bacterium]HOZ06855.1 hypothetical protein [candidate division Zixibacteria bacterium]HPM36626.1 hypothetical protein [candidate division Zixibacteria bacterium]